MQVLRTAHFGAPRHTAFCHNAAAARPALTRCQVAVPDAPQTVGPTKGADAKKFVPPPEVPGLKTAVITGGNTGIGFETAKALGAKGYHVVIACRSEERGKAALARLRDGNPRGKFELRMLQLDDLSSVRDFVKQAVDFGHGIDVLLNNAGVMATPPMKTVDGFEYQLGVNHLGHFALTTGLLPLMTNPEREGRIITVSSSAQMFGKINFEDINNTRDYSPWPVYGQSKLANAMFAFELAKRLPYSANLTSNCLHPGVVGTELARYLLPDDSWVTPLIKPVLSKFLKTPEQGAATSIYLASSPEVQGVTSKYYIDCKPSTGNAIAYDADQRERLWDLSCEMTGCSGDVQAAVDQYKKTLKL